MLSPVLLSLFLCLYPTPVWGQVLSADSYWNTRYGSEPGFVSYTNDDSHYGLWNHHNAFPYSTIFPYSMTCSGCSCTESPASCSGTNILIRDYAAVSELDASTFPNRTVTSIQLFRTGLIMLPDLGEAVSLQSLAIHSSNLEKLPNLKNATSLTKLIIYDSQLTSDPEQVFPASLTHIALVKADIEFIYDGWFSNQKDNLLILSLSGLRLKSFPREISKNLDNLLYLGLDGNQLEQFSASDVSLPMLQHLNLSNNRIDYIQPDLLSKFPQLRILELHNNNISHIPRGSLSNMPHLLHLDLNNNHLLTITSRAFTHLHSLLTLRLHSQKDLGLQSIHYNAFFNMTALKNLWISSNSLQSFPYSCLAGANYTDLQNIYADHNNISMLEMIDEEAFNVYDRPVLELRQAQHVPFATTPNVTSITLSFNSLGYLTKEVLCRMVILNSLYLDNNHLTEETIDNSFTCLQTLEILDLQSNDIQYITSILSSNNSLPSIRTLNLQSNKITAIQTGAFNELSTLLSIDLDFNLILTAENESFPDNIQTIYLSGNEFRFLHHAPFSNLSNLQVLTLNSNKISYLPVEAFTNCTNLNTLNLQSNSIGWIYKQHFENCVSLSTLYLDNNDLAYIEPGSLDHLTSLHTISATNNMLQFVTLGGTFNAVSITYLYLGNNRIKTISTGSFVDDTFNQMHLSSNRIAKIESGAFLRISATQLYLTNNPISEIETDAFRDSTFTYMYMSGIGVTIRSGAFNNIRVSQNLDLTSNNIETLEKETFIGVSIRNLILRNSNIKEIKGKIFGRDAASNPSSVYGRLDLSLNQISYLPDDALDDVDIEELVLDSNQITSYPAASLVGQGLSSIHIASNKIENIPLGSFTGFHDLEELDLSNNRLSILAAALFEPLTSLEKLYLQNNQITSADFTSFSDHSSIKGIDLANNNLTFFPAFTNTPRLEDVDLSNNQIFSLGYDAFLGVDLDTFKSIDLSGNPLSCDCYLYFSLERVNRSIIGGQCSVPSDATGISFATSDSKIDNYFLNPDHASKFKCSATNFRAAAERANVILVEWEAPTVPYPGGTLQNGTVWVYMVTCEGIASGTPTIRKNLTDNSLYSKISQLALTLLQSDGVLPNTAYRCYVALAINGSQPSGKSPPAYVTTPANNVPVISPPIGNADYSLQVALYDFSRSHPDFSGVSTASYTQPELVPSPFGGWPRVSPNPTADTFSEWYRVTATVNQVFENVVLVSLGSSTSQPSNRYFSEEYFPLDGLGYGHENSKDCEGNLHNFGFTAATRTGFTFHGIGNLSLGGGDELWVYINRQLVLEIITNPTDPDIPCKTINLEGAQDGRTITPYGGTVVGQTCVATEPLIDEQFSLQLELGDTYHLDIFLAERYGCKSRFYFETQSIDFLQPAEGDDPPTDYFVTVDEDLHIGGVVAEVTVTDVFIPGPLFNVTILKGNEARHFTLTSDTLEAREEATPPTDPVYNLTSLMGTDISFLECNSSLTSENLTDPWYNSTEPYLLQGSAVLLTLNSSLDREVADRYLLVMSVIDMDQTSYTTGTIVIRVKVGDVNDNCPFTLTTSYNFVPQPALKESPLIQLRASDADIGANADIRYYASSASISPPLSRYNESHLLMLYDTVYSEVSQLTFTLAAVDLGTPPRGINVNASVTLKNSCLLTVLLEEIEMRMVVNETTGDVYLRIPKYYVQTFECQRIGGLSTGTLLDSQLSASSSLPLGPPSRARLNFTRETFYGGWVAETLDSNQWLQINLTTKYRLTEILIHGREDAEMWVTTFSISHSSDGITFTTYSATDGTNVFTGNTDQNSIVSYTFDPPITNQYVRIIPVTWNNGISLRLEFYGCTDWEYQYYLTACQPCETTWYCPGDGRRLPCGRCDPPVDGDTCGRSPVEHSFGAMDHCSPCPHGWLCQDGYGSPCPKYQYSECNSTFCPEACTPCGLGHACFNGIRTQCRPGTYSDGYKESCAICDEGTYQPDAGQSSCLPCPKGHFSSKMKDRCNTCDYTSWADGAGSNCQQCGNATQCPCLNRPCPQGVTCFNLGGEGVSMCGECPPGYSGDGNSCTDINECFENDPCFLRRCINTAPGYQCLECPTGYKGTYEDALSWNVHRRIFLYGNKVRAAENHQICQDTDECVTGEGNCDQNAECINTVGSYTCGNCKDGYISTSLYGCQPDNFCTSGANSCHSDAECIPTGPGDYICQCPAGFAGDGVYCGEDGDLDGIPSYDLKCDGRSCTKDNCPHFPNSGQENFGSDKDGDACDNDDDSDGIENNKDNCRFQSNYNQKDTDQDGIGDACDNCPNDPNQWQEDTDGDGTGDVCDSDDDNDGVTDASDNCPLVANLGQENIKDTDSVGDACDNCPNDNNDGQTDLNQDGYGDACAAIGASDMDGDGIPNSLDNCIQTPNPDRSDVDGDDIGDLCDDDTDGDGVINTLDNCVYVRNTGQEEDNGNGIGNICEDDLDGDGTNDNLDPCPRIPQISGSGFSPYLAISLASVGSPSQAWQLNDDGHEIVHLPEVEDPQMLIGPHSVGSMDYYGTWYVDSDTRNESIGCVFAYQTNRHFYLVQWRRNNSNTEGYVGATRGLTLKLIDSTSGPGSTLSSALWHSDDTSGQVALLWQDEDMKGWYPYTPYRWHISHRPSIGIIRLRVYTNQTLLVDSGDIINTALPGGRLGVYVQGPGQVIWSSLTFRCVDKENYALSFDGVDDFVSMGTFSQYNLTDSFTIGLWVRPHDPPPSGDLQPLLCTGNSWVCVYLKNDLLFGQYGTAIVGNSSLPVDAWTHVALRYEAQYFTWTLLVNGTVFDMVADTEPLFWNGTEEEERFTMAENGSSYFSGTIDEVRFYRIWLTDAEVLSHVTNPNTNKPFMARYLSGHYSMDNVTDPTLLKDGGIYDLPGNVTGATYTQSTHHLALYRLAYP